MKKFALFAALALLACASSAFARDYVAVYEAELDTVNYLKSNKTDTMQLGYNTCDGLVEFDRFGLTMPSLATDWTVSEDGLTITLHVRPGVKWYTCEGKEYGEVTAHDFEAGAKWVLTKKNASVVANTIYNNIAGAKDYYMGKTVDWSTVGIKALDDRTIRYTFSKRLPYALKMLSFPAFYPASQKFIDECGDDFGTSNDTMLYCGAYILTEFEPEYQRVLTANEHYWNREAISIERMVYKYSKEASANGPELFLRGEVMDLILPGTIMDEWMKDPEKKKLMRPHNLTNMTYFMAFNFEPLYGEEYAPKDWVEAVNNLNFRKSLFHGFDRVAALLAMAPYDYQRRLTGTLTRRNLVQVKGVDYVEMGGLAEYTHGESFDPKKALEYKAKAMEELKGKVTFPLKVVMPYNTGNVDIVNRSQVVEQQMEKLLGTDYIDIILVPYPASGYNKASRTSGKFAFTQLGWGPDFVDPLSALDPVMASALSPKWSRLNMARDMMQPDGQTKFDAMAEAAAAEVGDLKKRYEMFAEAEKFLLDNAYVVPFYLSGGGFKASYLHPFYGFTSQMGINSLRKLKAAKLLDKPMNMEEYEAAEKQYLKELEEARKNAKYE